MFKEIPILPGYEIDKNWNVRNKTTLRTLKHKLHWKWYLMVDIAKKHHRVHRLVMRTFVWESELQVNHKNWIKTDNRLDNLEYVTGNDNIKHAFEIWLWKHRCNRVAQFNQEWVKIWEFVSHKDAARKLWLDQSRISKCARWEISKYKWFVFKNIDT